MSTHLGREVGLGRVGVRVLWVGGWIEVRASGRGEMVGERRLGVVWVFLWVEVISTSNYQVNLYSFHQ